MENESFPVPARALEFGHAGRVRPSRPASACFLSTLGLNLVLTRGIPPDFGGDVNLVLTRGIPPDFGGDVSKFIPPQPIGSARSLSGHAIAYRWRSLPRVRRHISFSSLSGMLWACYMLSDTESTGGEIKNRDDRYTVGRHNIVVQDFLYLLQSSPEWSSR